MTTILAIDSTTEILSISISEGSRILTEIRDYKSRRHMVNIIDNLDKAFINAGKSVKDVDAFTINLGPGDFTGGRIGISIVKIFAMLSQKPVIGFNSLDVFSAGYFFKNIGSIAEEEKKFTGIFIIPLMDVRNNEIFFSIYEIKKHKKDTEPIYEFDFKNDRYYLLKKYGNFLLNSEEFRIKFPGIIHQLSVFNDDSCSKCKQIFNHSNLSDEFNAPVVNKNCNNSKKEMLVVLTANCAKSYKLLLEKLKQDVKDKQSLTEIRINEDNINPDSKYINFLAEYNFINGLKSLPIAPVYVRDFMAFSKK